MVALELAPERKIRRSREREQEADDNKQGTPAGHLTCHRH